MRTINVAVAGLGFVGSETVRLLQANRERFARRLGARLSLAAVCDRHVAREARRLGLSREVFRATNPARIAAHPGIDIVVEVMGGLDAPRALVLDALRRGKHVVTANKRLLSHCWREIQAACAEHGGRIYFEGSVAGGIPILQALDNGLSANKISAVYGILNGTTNFILSRAEEGLETEEALREAQRLGLAEKDPTMDLDGTDTAHKVSVLASLITGAWIHPERIARQGIGDVAREDIVFAREELGRAARLLGTLRLHWGGQGVGVEAHVYPTLVPLGHPLAAVRGEYNALLVKASSAGDLMFYGKGAGPGPAASAVTGDVFMLARDLLGAIPPKKAFSRDARLIATQDSVSPFYIRLHVDEKSGVLAAITAALADEKISIASIHQSDTPKRHGIPIIITTRPTSQGQLQQALARIMRLKTVSRAHHTVMRMLDSA